MGKGFQMVGGLVPVFLYNVPDKLHLFGLQNTVEISPYFFRRRRAQAPRGKIIAPAFIMIP
jgi:hypothetical protein